MRFIGDWELVESDGATSSRHSALSVTLGLLLVASLVAALVGAWSSPEAEGRKVTRQARRLLDEGRYTQAVSLLERALPRYSKPETRLLLSYAYLARRDVERAERQVVTALPRAARDLRPALLAQLGRVHALAGREAQAHRAFGQAVDEAARYKGVSPIENERQSALWHRAMLYWRGGRWAEAQLPLEELLDGAKTYSLPARAKLAQLIGPEDPQRSQRLVAEARALGNARLEEPLDIRYQIPDMRLAGVEEGMDEPSVNAVLDALERAHTAAVRLAPEDRPALWGASYLEQGENLLAQMYLRRAVELNPEDAEARARLALTLLNTGDRSGALTELERAVKLQPSIPLPHHVLARLAMQRGDWAEANRALETVKRLEPQGIELYLELAEYHRLRGEYEEAESALIDALEQQRLSGASAGRIDVALQLSRFYTDVRGLGCEKGLPAAKEALSRRPDDPESFDAVGWALFQCGNYVEAERALGAAVSRAPDVPRYRYHLGKAYARLGNLQEARNQYTWASDLDPAGPWEGLAIEEIISLGGE